MKPIVIDCTTCPVRGTACGDCMVTAVAALGPLTQPPPDGDQAFEGLALDADDHLVVDRFVRAGLLASTGAWEVRVVADTDEHRRVG